MRRSRFQVRGSRSEEHTSELQSHHPISYAVFCLKKKTKTPSLTNLSRRWKRDTLLTPADVWPDTPRILAIANHQGCLGFFFFNDTATTEIYTGGYTLSLHDALPIYDSADEAPAAKANLRQIACQLRRSPSSS